MTTPGELEAANQLLDRMTGPPRPLGTSGPTPAELAAQLDLEGKTQARSDALLQTNAKQGQDLEDQSSPGGK